MYKFFVLAAVLACANAGLIGAPVATYAAAPAYASPAYAAYGHAAVAPAAVTSSHSNILRSYGNLGQVSTYSKTIDTPYSSVSKSDVRVSNPGYAAVSYRAPAYAYAAPAVAHAPVAYAAPAVAHAPVAAYAAAPVAKAGLIGVAYSAAPVVSHMTYANSLGIQYAW